ncbi:MAG: hypothetical protein IJD39_03615 [Clostridia bacterium]|nr:hypothetical protein [Clostridia bacterium]
MKHEMKGMKRALICLMILNLIAGGGLIALAENAALTTRTPAEMELDALIQAYEMTRYRDFAAGEWYQQPWYAGLMEQYGLQGQYSYGWAHSNLAVDETEAAHIATRYWEEACGITPFNDLSQASEVHLIEHVLDGVVRPLYLIDRVHEDRMPSFYVLMDGKTNEILASSSVAEYQKRHAEVMILVEEERAAEDRMQKKAVEAVMEKYAASLPWLNDPYWQNANIFSYYTLQQQEFIIRLVEIRPFDSPDQDFVVYMDDAGETVYAVRWLAENNQRCTDEQKQEAIDAFLPLESAAMALLEEYGAFYRIPLQEKAAFYQQCKSVLDENNRWDFLFLSPVLQTSGLLDDALLLPGEDCIPEEKARELVLQALISKFLLTDAQAQSLTWYSSLKQTIIPGLYEWEFWLDLGDEMIFTGNMEGNTGDHLFVVREGGQQDNMRAEILTSLEARYGNWGEWPIEIKAKYARIYMNGDHPYGVPGEGHLTVEEALELAKTTLLNTYPELTREQLDSARICPYFMIEPHSLYRIRFEANTYYFTFELSGDYACYEIIFSGETGEVYLTHDPSNSGNG